MKCIMVTPEEIKAAIEAAIQTTYVLVETFEGQDHFRAVVVSPEFAGKSRIAQHKMVYAPLKEEMVQAIHALELSTWAPLEWADKQREGEKRDHRISALFNSEDKVEKQHRARPQ